MNLMEQLLISGGDTRLAVDSGTGLNRFGCAPIPRPGVLSFGSCTASTISPEAFRHVQRELEKLQAAACPDDYLDTQFEQLRHGLKSVLGLDDTGAEIIFSPSGTDSTLHALFLTRALNDKAGNDKAGLDCILPASDETGTGVPLALQGRHFSDRTSEGSSVTSGTAIAGLAENVRLISLPGRSRNGVNRHPECQDQDVWEAVEHSVQAGRRVLLQVMDSSKLGAAVPSRECLRRIQSCFAGSVQIVVDACQMRLGLRRLREHLELGHLVLISGSKFFTGPAFSGALLVPALLSGRIGKIRFVPPGLRDYASRSAWPQCWPFLRASLPPRPSAGQFLRWAAALFEMRAYFAVPADFRCLVLRQFADEATAQLRHNPDSLLLAAPYEAEADTRTIFPFLVQHDSEWMSYAKTVTLYHALNRDLSAHLPTPPASALCHIGQPVRVPRGPGKDVGALRICADARLVSGMWAQTGTGTRRTDSEHTALLSHQSCPATEDAGDPKSAVAERLSFPNRPALPVPVPLRDQISTILAKISLLAPHIELVPRLEVN